MSYKYLAFYSQLLRMLLCSVDTIVNLTRIKVTKINSMVGEIHSQKNDDGEHYRINRFHSILVVMRELILLYQFY